MSTSFYIPCEDCIKKVEHIHRASDYAVAETFGMAKGKVGIDHRDYINDETLLMSEYGTLETLGQIKERLKK